ncbi:SPOR domain-containing protein [Fodinicurvata sediminis]|uniref:SPOR domain-containing protein n=1 Tax=Fodinicurvata sediminis TaxID=1121832 RepID=UPI0003B2F412|nr:SPOR domain-containing protein [Fodinicurvata sediminis]
MTYDPRFSWNDEASPGELQGEQRTTRKKKGDGRGPRRLIPAVIAVLGFLLFAGIVWYAYSWGRSDGASEAIPIVEAPEGPEKERPENPGGMEVPYQDTLVLNPGNGQGEGQEVERLLPPPEEPVEREETEASQEPTEEATAELDAAGEEELQQTTAEETETEETSAASEEAGEAESSDTGETPEDLTEASVEGEGETASSEEAAEDVEDVEAGAEEAATEEDATQEPSVSSQSVAQGFRIQLAAVRSTEAAEAEWQRLQAKHEALLGSLSLNIERAELGEQGVYYRIQAGPFSDEQAAETLCEDLKSRDQACLVRSPQ